MRELEFLPDWYPRLRKRKRTVGVQAWATATLLGGLCLWGWLSGRNIQTASASLVLLKGEINQADSEVQRLNEAMAQQKELQAKDVILGKLGRHVESSRVLAAVDAAMPEEMAILNFTTEVKETPRAVSGLAAERAVQKNASLVDRRLDCTVLGVGPTDATLAKFIRNLEDSGLFDRINVSIAEQRVENNHVMRQFAVTFGVDLNRDPSLAPGARPGGGN